MSKKGKHQKIDSKLKKFIILSLTTILIVSIGYIVYYFYINKKDKQENTNIINDIIIDKTQITDIKTERILQLEELKKQNSDIIGWLEIEDTNINYPVVQSDDNDFYLTHNYKKEYSISGSLFLDKNFDIKNGSSNYLIYGHRNNNGLMFEDLMKYADENFYKSHKKIRFTTLEKDKQYEIMSVFYSRVYYKNEKDVFRYYYFVNAKNEAEYNNFIEDCKKVSIYDTGVTAKYGEQLLTLSTCEYSQEDGRFVVVAKEINQDKNRK